MHVDLSFEQAPPIGVPFRFFLTAPWFGAAAGCLLMRQGGELLASRWTMGALALTHLLVLGFLLQGMIGALFQFVPVAVGGNLWRARQVASLVHPTLTAGTVLLCAGFLLAWPFGLQAAAVLLVAAGATFLATIAWALARTPAVGATVAALRGASVALTVTLGLGALLVVGLTTERTWPLIELVHVHAAWGLGGWALLLLAAVAATAMPMFQMTPPFPVRAATLFPWLVIGALLMWSARLDGQTTRLASVGLFALLALAATFFVVALRLQARRRRKVQDANFLLFRAALVTGLAAATLCAWLGAGLAGSSDPRLQVANGVLVVATFVFAVNGMLYKIVPFVNWLHLKLEGGPRAPAPTINRMIPAPAMDRQARMQLVAFAMLFAATLWPTLTRPAGAALAVSFAWLGLNLIGAVSTYRNFRGHMPTAAA